MCSRVLLIVKIDNECVRRRKEEDGGAVGVELEADPAHPNPSHPIPSQPASRRQVHVCSLSGGRGRHVGAAGDVDVGP